MFDRNNEPTVGAQAPSSGPTWERSVLEKLAFSALQEQKRARRWGIFFKLLAFAYLTFAAVMFLWQPLFHSSVAAVTKHTALIEVQGVIESQGEVNADTVNASLRAAFEDQQTAGVVMRINSPGGSPVQAGLIYDEMRRLRAKYPDTPLYAVVEDICASGGYYIAAGADRIYVDKASIVGSIGVIMESFGFSGVLEKVGVERRVYTAGENKAIMDPFSPVNPEHKAHVESMLKDVHQQFIQAVKQGRGERLKNQQEIFSGLFWTGDKAIQLGLADAAGSLDSVARDVVKADAVIDFTERESVAERLVRRLGAATGQAASKALTGARLH